MDRRNLTEAAGTFRRGDSDSTMARMRRETGEPSSVRCEIGGEMKPCIIGTTGKSGKAERVTEGPVVVEKRSNVRGAKRPCCW
jgi:hypothetical protein